MNTKDSIGNIDKETEKLIAEAIEKQCKCNPGKKCECDTISGDGELQKSSCSSVKEKEPVEKKEPVVMKVTPRNKIGRNQDCPCGSGKKYKKCCLLKREYTPGA